MLHVFIMRPGKIKLKLQYECSRLNQVFNVVDNAWNSKYHRAKYARPELYYCYHWFCFMTNTVQHCVRQGCCLNSLA